MTPLVLLYLQSMGRHIFFGSARLENGQINGKLITTANQSQACMRCDIETKLENASSVAIASNQKTQ